MIRRYTAWPGLLRRPARNDRSPLLHLPLPSLAPTRPARLPARSKHPQRRYLTAARLRISSWRLPSRVSRSFRPSALPPLRTSIDSSGPQSRRSFGGCPPRTVYSSTTMTGTASADQERAARSCPSSEPSRPASCVSAAGALYLGTHESEPSLCAADVLGPPVSLLLNPRPRWRVNVVRLGCCLCPLSLLLSSFAKAVRPQTLLMKFVELSEPISSTLQPWQLLLTQGLLYSIGGAMACQRLLLILPKAAAILTPLEALGQITRPSSTCKTGFTSAGVSPTESASRVRAVTWL